MTKCMFNVTKGEYLYKEILFNNARHFGTKGLGSFPKPPENCPRSPELKDCFNKEVGSYCQYCQDVGHHTRECPLPNRTLPSLPFNYKSQFDNHHFLLSKLKNGKVKAKFIGTQEKKKLPRPTMGSQSFSYSHRRTQSCLGSQTSRVIHLCVGELQSRWKALGAR